MKSATQRRWGSLARPRLFSELRRSRSADSLLLGSLRRQVMSHWETQARCTHLHCESDTHSTRVTGCLGVPEGLGILATHVQLWRGGGAGGVVVI